MAEQVNQGIFDVSASGHWRLIKEFLFDAKASRSEYADLLEALRSAQDRGASAEEAARAISSNAPKFTTLAAWLKTQEGVATATWLAVFIAVIAYLLPRSSTSPEPTHTTNVNVTVDESPTPEELDEAVQRVLEERGSVPEETSGAVSMTPSPGRSGDCDAPAGP